MSSTRFYKFKHIYIELSTVLIPTTTFLGIVTGIFSNDRDTKPIDSFINIIGYSSIGAITGITYPVSYPLLGGYVLYKNFIVKK